MSDAYLCWWPGEGETEADAHEIEIDGLSGILPRPVDHEHAAEIAAEECGKTMREQTICVRLKSGTEVKTFVVERVDEPQFKATEVV